MKQNTHVCNNGAFLPSSVGVKNSENMGSLGIVTKTSSPPLKSYTYSNQEIDNSTGEILPKKPLKRDHVSARNDRWAFKSVVNKIMPSSRTSKCMNYRVKNGDGGLSEIQIQKTGKGKAFYSGLMACGSVWTCPVCAAKVSERRRLELKEAMEVAKTKGFNIHFVTLTFPHGVGDDVKVLRKKLSKAYGKLSNGKYSVKSKFKEYYPDSEIHGFIRAVEVTHGTNGFHPHVHILLFSSPDLTAIKINEIYNPSWKRACVLSDLPEPSTEHGCTVKDGSFASEYISKWGIEDEMTKANSKVSRSKKGVTPFGLLRCFIDGNDPIYTPEKSKNLFLVYANAFKGARQLYWSNGLRNLLSMSKEISDKELVDIPEDERSILLGTLSFEQWKIIRRKKLEPVLLSIAESDGSDSLKTFITLTTQEKSNRILDG